MNKISIIIPVYNVEKYIRECLESCINQTLKDIEIIIVDDCGSDKSMDIAKEYAKKDGRVKIIKNRQNQGPFVSRNNAVLAANGEYLVFLDSDDFLDLKACEIAYNATKDGYYDIVTFGSYYWNDGASVFSELKPCSFDSGDEFGNWLFRSKNISWNIWGRLIKKDIYHANLDFLMGINSRLIMAEDVLAMFIIYNNCKRLNFISNMLYYYRYNPSSSTNDKSIENMKSCVRSFEIAIAKMREFALNNKCNKRWQKLYISLGVHECNILKRALKIKESKFGFIDKIIAFVEGRWFVIRRKLRVKFGI
ncbi:glycosyltransferase [Campylobacter sp. CX2-8023-23]|uniref:Glycosyltransferase n=1 Tax=Campylobacter porcelli TaxID=1660073 RepID=A0ABU7M6F0_9BACT|nr:glycosyltransferase [Campylobacter sp. CX2-8023-23]MEE3745208.1 glycosyltransferase [Campylobacter sp. CX2-4855-23]